MRNYAVENVDDYIAGAEPEARPTLIALRELVKSTIPEATESISWGVPFYKYHDLLAGFSVFKAHVSFGLAFALDEEIRKELAAEGYSTGSKTIQIRFDQQIPAAAITQMLKLRAELNANKGDKKT